MTSKRNFVTLNGVSITFLLMVCVLVAGILLYHWKRRHMYKLASKIHGPKAYPLIGSSLRIIHKPEDIFEELMKLAKEYPPPFVFWLGPKLYWIISQPDDLQIFLNSPAGLNKPQNYQFLPTIFGQGLLSAQVPVWKKTRKLIGPFFSSKNMTDMTGTFSNASKLWVESALLKHSKHDVFDIMQYLKYYTYYVIFEITLGKKLSKKEIDNLNNWNKTLMKLVYERMNRIWLFPQFIFDCSSHGKKYWEIEGVYQNFIKKIIEESKLRISKETPIKSNDEKEGETNTKIYVDFLLELAKKDDIFTETQIKDEVHTLINTGFDTVVHTMGFVFLMLAIHQDIQQKVYEEVFDVLGQNRDIEPNDLSNLVFLDRVIRETLRIYPASPITSHLATDDVKLATCTIPKDATVLVSAMCTHRDPKYWPEPLKFDPDRFLPDEIEKRHPYCYVPFSAGPRSCIGQRFAMINLKVVVATVVRRFKVTTEFKSVEDVRLKNDIVLIAKDGFNVSVEPRQLCQL